jgi:hypothetical protein
MKKTISIAAVILTPFILNAQNTKAPDTYNPIFNTCAIICVIGLFMIFFLTVFKKVMEYRLKNKIVERGIPENVASSILQTNPKEDRNTNIKWAAILAGLGAGFTIIYYTLPLGIHSLAIMAFSVAASFLSYFFFLKQSE